MTPRNARFPGLFILIFLFTSGNTAASAQTISQPWISLLLLNDETKIPDSTPPLILSATPANDATNVSVTSYLSVTFNEAMDQTTINEDSFYLRYGTYGAFFAGSLGYSGHTARFTPAGMPFDAQMSATVTTGVKDLAGNALPSNYTWSFHTAPPPLGDPDTTFGTGGRMVTDISGAATLSGNGDMVRSLLLQPDGKIVAAGTSYAGIANLDDFSLARYNANGSLDQAFGTGGRVMIDFGGDDYLRGAVMQSDGKIIVAGASFIGCCGNLVLARFDTDGALDTTYGTDGIVVTDLGGNDSLTGIGIRADDKILLSAGNSNGSVLLQYNTDGTLDAAFGEEGVVSTAFLGYLTVQPDEKIVVAGTLCCNDFGLARYKDDGSLDTTFGAAGIAITDFGYDDNVQALALAPDGKIVVAGWSLSDRYTFALARYQTDGTSDANFGGSGRILTDFAGLSGTSVNAVAVQPDGKIVAAGQISYINSADKLTDFALARYNTDGTLDATFGTGGLATTDFNNGSDRAYALAIQSDGKIVAAGSTNTDFALARYLSQ